MGTKLRLNEAQELQKVLLYCFVTECANGNFIMKNTMTLPKPLDTYIRAINAADLAAFQSCFVPAAVVQDNNREIRGLEAISHWARHEIFAVNVSLEIEKATTRGAEFVVTFKIDGTFDRTGLPDPFVMDHGFTLAGDKITSLTCVIAKG